MTRFSAAVKYLSLTRATSTASGADPEIRFLPDGTPTAIVSLATSEAGIDKKSGEKKERTEWRRVVFVAGLAEVARDFPIKGGQVYVEGQLRKRKWTDKDQPKKHRPHRLPWPLRQPRREHFDLRHILERDRTTLGPKLKGGIHIYCGDMDNYYLNNAAYLTEDFLKKTRDPYYDGQVAYGDRAEHCWNGDPANPNAISRLRYNTLYLPKILKRIEQTAPPGADLKSWRY